MGSVLLPQSGSSRSDQSTSKMLLSSSSNSSRNRIDFVESCQYAQRYNELPSIRSGHRFIHAQQLFGDRTGYQEHRVSQGPTSSNQSAINSPESVYAPRGTRHRTNLESISEQTNLTDRLLSNIRSEQGTRDNVQTQRDVGNSNHSLQRSFTSMLREKKTRRRLIALITSAIFLILVLALYFAFTISKSNLGRELHILLIFMILILAIVFCHSLIRFSMVVLCGSGSAMAMNRIPSRAGPTGFAEPDRPIHVILAGDGEILAESDGTRREKVAPPPPAYGLWRSSVKINPDLLYWHHVKDDAPPLPQHANHIQGSGNKAPLPRPPSYTSDNGIDYVIEAQPRPLIQGPTAERPGH